MLKIHKFYSVRVKNFILQTILYKSNVTHNNLGCIKTTITISSKTYDQSPDEGCVQVIRTVFLEPLSVTHNTSFFIPSESSTLKFA